MRFDPFGDFETAGYLQNSLQLKDPTEVKESEHLSFESSIEDALAYLSEKKSIDYRTVLKVHEILFSDFYHWAGKIGMSLYLIWQSSRAHTTIPIALPSSARTSSRCLSTMRLN